MDRIPVDLVPRPQEADTAATQGSSTAYDSIWAQTGTPEPVGLEKVFLAEDKIFVVLAVVLIIWLGIVYFIFRTDRKISKLERSIEENISDSGTA